MLALMMAGFWLAGRWTPLPPPTGSILYLLPAGGLNTPPTAGQVARLSLVTANVSANASGTVTIVHNLGLSAGDLAEGLPRVRFEPSTPAFYTQKPVISSKTANSVVLTSAGTENYEFVIEIERPHSMTL